MQSLSTLFSGRFGKSVLSRFFFEAGANCRANCGTEDCDLDKISHGFFTSNLKPVRNSPFHGRFSGANLF